MTIYVVRHAETELNATRVVQPPGTPLSERGQRQAALLSARLAEIAIDRIVSSDLPRAVATAREIHHRSGAPLTLDPDLQERNFGAIRGTPYAELGEDIFGPAYVPPLGESWSAFHARVDGVWGRLSRAAPPGPGALVVVTHGLVCWSIVSRHVAPTEIAYTMRFGNTSVTRLEGPAPWRAAFIDCTAHLDASTRGDGARA